MLSINYLKYVLRNRYIFKVLAVLSLIVAIIFTIFYPQKSVYDKSETKFKGIVYKKKINNDKTAFYIKGKEKIVINYYQELLEDINLGDEISVSGKIKVPSNNTVPNQFNYKRYLLNNNIFYTVTAKSVTKTANNTNVIYYLKGKINERIDKITYANEYLKIFILGDTSSLDEETSKSYQQNGVSHLFSISGMHISLFAAIILYVMKRISYNNYYNYSIVISFLIFYSLLVGSSPSVIRSLTMYILFAINKLFNLKIKNLDIMCFVLTIMLIINPYCLYNISFQYSYLISFSLVLFSYKLKNIKNKIMKSLYTSFISFLVSFPICIYNFYQVNVFSIILNIFLIPFVSIIIFPLSLVCFIIPKLSVILNIFTSILQFVSLTIYKYKIGQIVFSKPSIIIVLIYYILIYLFIYNKKNIYLLIIIVSHKLYPLIDSSFTVTYLDVGQGDSIFIKYPHNQGNILIDTGGIVNSDYQVAINKTIPYLKSFGVTKLDYLILTHGDYDHMGDSNVLVNNFKVKNVVFNCGPINTLEKELNKLLKEKQIPSYYCINKISIKNNKLEFLNTKHYDNENDNSNVIYTNYNNYRFLFMGDAGLSKEKDILKKYNLESIDFLKVGHHGSNTSSSEEFITNIHPKYSLISVGKNNKYGHPKESVLEVLSNSKVYRTDLNGSIEIKISNNKYMIKTYSP